MSHKRTQANSADQISCRKTWRLTRVDIAYRRKMGTSLWNKNKQGIASHTIPSIRTILFTDFIAGWILIFLYTLMIFWNITFIKYTAVLFTLIKDHWNINLSKIYLYLTFVRRYIKIGLKMRGGGEKNIDNLFLKQLQPWLRYCET